MYVRPHLEFCAAAWNPFRKGDIDRLEQVQRRATKLVPQVKFRSYQFRLEYLGLPTLEERRLRGDLIQQFKFSKGLNSINLHRGIIHRSEMNMTGPSANTRGPEHRLYGQFTRIDRRKWFFTNRIVSVWNGLDSSVVASNSVNSFKNGLDKHLKLKHCSVNGLP